MKLLKAVFLIFISTQAFTKEDPETLEIWLKCRVLKCKGNYSFGGACGTFPGGPLDAGPGGFCSASPGGPLYAGPGGALYAGPGGSCFSGANGPCEVKNGKRSSSCPMYCLSLSELIESENETHLNELMKN